MSELAQERSHIHASIVKSALVTHQPASDMKEFTQERSRIHASIAKKKRFLYVPETRPRFRETQ